MEDEQSKQGISLNKKPIEASKALLATGIIIAVFGIALLIILPNLHCEHCTQSDANDLHRNTMLGGLGMVMAGVNIGAIGFIKSTSTQPDRQEAEISEMKQCPDCAESIKFAASVCRYCGHKFS